MSYTLYNAPQSTCSQRVRFVLNAKKLSFAEVKLDLLAGDQLKPKYLALNPNGVVPTLDHDGAIVINSSVITMSEDEFLAFAESKPLRKEFMLAMGRKGFPEKDMDAAMQRLRRTYERMDTEIEKSGGPWLLGSDITLADIAVMPAIVRMSDLGQETAWQDLPRLQRWYEAIRAHPAFEPTYYPGSLLTERFPHLRERAKQD